MNRDLKRSMKAFENMEIEEFYIFLRLYDPTKYTPEAVEIIDEIKNKRKNELELFEKDKKPYLQNEWEWELIYKIDFKNKETPLMDILYTCLNNIGLSVLKIGFNDLEDNIIINRFFSPVNGLIEVENSPIRWIIPSYRISKDITNVLEIEDYRNIYLIPDPNLGLLKGLNIVSIWFDHEMKNWTNSINVKKKEFKDHFQLEIVKDKLMTPFNSDEILIQHLSELGDSVKIYFNRLQSPSWQIHSSLQYCRGVDKWQPPPSRKLWECYEAIARHLLEFSNQFILNE